MCCCGQNYKQNGGIAGVLDVGTGVAIFVVTIEMLGNYSNLSILMYCFGALVIVTSSLTLAYILRLNKLLRDDSKLRHAVKVTLLISFLIQAPILYFTWKIKEESEQKDDQTSAIDIQNSRLMYLNAVYILVAFHSLCAIGIFCSVNKAKTDMEEYATYIEEYDNYNKDNISNKTEGELSPLSRNKPIVSFGDPNPAGSFVSTSDQQSAADGKGSASAKDTSMQLSKHTIVSMESIDHELPESEEVSEINYSRYTPSVKSQTPFRLNASRAQSYYSDRSLRKINPRVYKKVKSIDLEIGGSDDEDITSKSTLVTGPSS